MGRLSIAERNQALEIIQAGRSTLVVANHFNCHHSTIVRICQRFAVTNSVADRPRTGRQRVTTRNQDRRIRLAHLRDRFTTATSTARETPASHRQRIIAHAVRRRLKESRLSARRPYRGPLLTRKGCSGQEVICNGIVYVGEESFFWRIPVSSVPIRWSNTNLEASWVAICVLLRRGSWPIWRR